MTAMCIRCGKREVEAGRRKFCSDACADSHRRDGIKLMRKLGLGTKMTPRRWFTVTDYRNK